jgi:hypothetical protein
MDDLLADLEDRFASSRVKDRAQFEDRLRKLENFCDNMKEGLVGISLSLGVLTFVFLFCTAVVHWTHS